MVLGGDADLSVSTGTSIKEDDSFQADGAGRNIHYGVREHAMASISNGIAYHGGLKNFVATFFCFADYMRPALRLAAMNHLPVINVWTHDSIGVGEDGPTHQPVEHLMSLRVIPNFTVIRPADANESVQAWKYAVKHLEGPTGIVCTRQNVKVVTSPEKSQGLFQGAYVLETENGADSNKIDAILIATGSEVALASEAKAELEANHGLSVRLVSMPSWEIFENTSEEYRNSVLPPNVSARISVEAGSTQGWQQYVGLNGTSIGIDRFGASAPAAVNWEKFGFTVQNVVKQTLKCIEKCSNT